MAANLGRMGVRRPGNIRSVLSDGQIEELGVNQNPVAVQV